MAILIVDDSKDFRLIIEKMLNRAGCGPLLFASSAMESFKLLGIEGEKTKPEIDLILMDKMMPGVSGTEAIKRIKADVFFHDVPVIVVTADVDKGSLEEAFSAGASDYIVKPVDETELLARVRSALVLKRETDSRKATSEEFRKFAFVVEQNPTSIMILDTDLKIEYLNPAFALATGYEVEELIGKRVDILRSDEHSPDFYDAMWETLRSGEVWRGDLCTKRKGGDQVWELINISPVKGPAGTPTHFVSIKVDDTERRIAERRLMEKKEELDNLRAESYMT